MGTHRETVLAWIDERVDALSASPRMWGSDESVGAQVLLLQFRYLTLQPEFDDGDPGALVDQYMEYLTQRYPDKPHRPLHRSDDLDPRWFNRARELKEVVALFNGTTSSRFLEDQHCPGLAAEWPGTPDFGCHLEEGLSLSYEAHQEGQQYRPTADWWAPNYPNGHVLVHCRACYASAEAVRGGTPSYWLVSVHGADDDGCNCWVSTYEEARDLVQRIPLVVTKDALRHLGFQWW